jgi:hypothetical protein
VLKDYGLDPASIRDAIEKFTQSRQN